MSERLIQEVSERLEVLRPHLEPVLREDRAHINEDVGGMALQSTIDMIAAAHRNTTVLREVAGCLPELEQNRFYFQSLGELRMAQRNIFWIEPYTTEYTWPYFLFGQRIIKPDASELLLVKAHNPAQSLDYVGGSYSNDVLTVRISHAMLAQQKEISSRAASRSLSTEEVMRTHSSRTGHFVLNDSLDGAMILYPDYVQYLRDKGGCSRRQAKKKFAQSYKLNYKPNTRLSYSLDEFGGVSPELWDSFHVVRHIAELAVTFGAAQGVKDYVENRKAE